MVCKLLSLALCLALAFTCFGALAEGEYPIVEEPITVTAIVDTNNDSMDPRLSWTALEDVTGIHVDFTLIENDALAVFMAAGDWPDFFHLTLKPSYINDYGILGGMFVDYNDYLDIMPNLVQTFEDYPESDKVVREVNGAIYQLPRMERSATTCQARVYYRADVMEKAGLKMPATTEEFYDVLTALKAFNDGAAPLDVSFTASGYFEPFMYASFGPSTQVNFEDDGTGKVVYNRTSEQYKLYMEYVHRLYADGLLHPEYLTLDGSTELSLAAAGLTVFMGSTAHSLTEADFPSGHVDLGVLAPLTSEYDDEQVVLGSLGVDVGGFAINAQSKYIPEICKMLDVFFATEEVVPGTGVYGIIGCYGPEGGMWRFANEEKTMYEFVLPEGYEGTTTNYQYKEVIYTNCGRVDVLANAVTSTPGNAQSRQLGFVKNLLPYGKRDEFPTGLLKFTEDEQAMLDKNYVDIDTYVNNMRSQFITGVSSVETDWDAYCNRVKAMGIDDVLAVYQAAYDRWNSIE
ncbi:MAG: extracellular solute-binding protein [Christensenellales bacterium]|jgi:putative aldouronate transport system substrate-binding protein